MVEYLIEATTVSLAMIGIAIWLGVVAYAVSKGWHKAKAEYPTTINTYNHRPK